MLFSNCEKVITKFLTTDQQIKTEAINIFECCEKYGDNEFNK